MGPNNDRGRQFEDKIARLTRAKVDKSARRNAGSHSNWHRRSDIFTSLPLHIEAKDHETIKIKEWFRQADDAASFGETPVVVFHDDENIMAVLKYDDLLNFMVEIADLKAEVEDLQKPSIELPELRPRLITTKEDAAIVARQLGESVAKTTSKCRAGHIADQYGFCMQTKCKYSRGYRPPKKERKK